MPFKTKYSPKEVTDKVAVLVGKPPDAILPHGHNLVLTAGSLKVVGPGDEVVASKKVDPAHLMAATEKSMTAAAIKKMMQQFSKTVSPLDEPVKGNATTGKTWLSGGKGTGAKADDDSWGWAKKPAGPVSDAAKKPEKVPADLETSDGNPIPNYQTLEMPGVETDLKAPAVSLAEATKLYQPVKATSGGSRYFVVALGSRVNIAARYKGKLSVRVEGDLTDSIQAILSGVGLDHAGEAHFSIHCEPESNIEAAMVVGAIMGALASVCDWKHAAVNWPVFIKGKGS